MRRLLLMTLLAAWITGTAGVAQTRAAEPVQEIALTMENGRFNPELLKVEAGTAFMLVVTNKDPMDDELEIESLKIERVIPAGRTRRVKMPALRPGTYHFVAERAEATASGRLIAE